jgi:catechol 2,3-dioxygenase-like lactoylglutathione lyase family enzyme
MNSMSESKQAYPHVMGHIGVVVSNIDEAFAWYRDILGFTPVMEPDTVEAGGSHFGDLAQDAVGEDFGEMQIAHLATGNHVGFELFEFDGVEKNDQKAMTAGITHFCVQDPNIEEMVNRIVNSGGDQLSSKIWNIYPDRPEYQMCYCTDPWGNIVELHSRGYEHMHCNID